MKILATLTLALAAQTVSAQTQYSADLAESFNTFRGLMARAERTAAPNKSGLLGIQTEAFELQKKLGAIIQESAQANLALVRSGEPNDRNLLLISSSDDTLMLGKKFLDYYIYTGDKFFLTQANGAAAMAKTVQAAIK